MQESQAQVGKKGETQKHFNQLSTALVQWRTQEPWLQDKEAI